MKKKKRKISKDPAGTSAGRWVRNPNGTSELKYGKNGDIYHHQIANHAIRIQTIIFTLSNRDTKVSYLLEFESPEEKVCTKIRHEDLADEQTFYKAAPPGFSLTSIPKAFSLLRECLMSDLPAANREAVLTILGWYLWNKKPIFAHAGRIISSDHDYSDSSLKTPEGTTQLLGLIDINAVCSDVPMFRLLQEKIRPYQKLMWRFQNNFQNTVLSFQNLKQMHRTQSKLYLSF